MIPIEASPYKMLATAKENAVPLFASFELTPRCNFNCKMCYVHLKDSEIKNHGNELTAEQWIGLGKQVMHAGALFLCITGGEPTRHPEFNRIYSELSRMGFIVTLQSNLYHFDDAVLELLKSAPPKMIKFTVYGANDTTYNKICGVKDGFARVMKNIELLKSLGIPLTSVTTVTKDNLSDLPEISRLMKELNIPWAASAGLRKSLRGAEASVEDLRIPFNSSPHPCEDGLNELNKTNNKKCSKPCEKCREYRTGFWIKWDGKMSFCSFLDEPEINVTALGFDEAWRRLVAYEEGLQWPQECRECKLFEKCPVCIATLATESGTVKEVNKEYCRYIDRILNYTNGGTKNG